MDKRTDNAAKRSDSFVMPTQVSISLWYRHRNAS